MGNHNLRIDILSFYISSFLIFLGICIISPILPFYSKIFNVSYTLVSLSISAYAFGLFTADVPVGILAYKWGRRPLMIAGSLLLTVAAFLNAMARNFPEFLLYRFFQGVGSAMWITSGATLLADILKSEEQGRVMSYFQAFMLLGSGAGPAIGGFVASYSGIKETFYFYGMMGIISLIITYIWIKEPESIAHDKEKGKFDLLTVKRLLCNPSFSMACLTIFIVFFMRTGIRGTMIPLYAEGVLGFNIVTIGAVISYATIANLIIMVPMGRAIDYFGKKLPMVFNLLITAIAILAFPFTENYLMISLVTVLYGIGTGGAGLAPLAMATEATINEPRGLSIGLYRLFSDIGFVVGPIILGFIADNYGLKMPFYFMTVLILVSTILVQLFTKETYRSRDNI